MCLLTQFVDDGYVAPFFRGEGEGMDADARVKREKRRVMSQTEEGDASE